MIYGDYDTDLGLAPKDQRVIVLIPTFEEDEDMPFVSEEIAYLDPNTGRWEGEWRHIVEEDGKTPALISKGEPVAWAFLPECEDEMADALAEAIAEQTKRIKEAA